MRQAGGVGTTRSVILVATPSVPSEPTNAPEQVVARRVDALAAAELHDLAVGQHDLEPGHVVRREAVLEAVRAAGVLGDVAADRADDLGRRVGRVVVRRARPPRRPRGWSRPARRRCAGCPGRPRGSRRIRDSTISTPSSCGSAPPREPRAGAARDDRHAGLVAGARRRAAPRRRRRAATAARGSAAYCSSPSDSYVRSWCGG